MNDFSGPVHRSDYLLLIYNCPFSSCSFYQYNPHFLSMCMQENKYSQCPQHQTRYRIEENYQMQMEAGILHLKTHLCSLQQLLCFLLGVTDKHFADLIGNQQSIVIEHHEVVAGILQILQRFLWGRISKHRNYRKTDHDTRIPFLSKTTHFLCL